MAKRISKREAQGAANAANKAASKEAREALADDSPASNGKNAAGQKFAQKRYDTLIGNAVDKLIAVFDQTLDAYLASGRAAIDVIEYRLKTCEASNKEFDTACADIVKAMDVDSFVRSYPHVDNHVRIALFHDAALKLGVGNAVASRVPYRRALTMCQTLFVLNKKECTLTFLHDTTKAFFKTLIESNTRGTNTGKCSMSDAELRDAINEHRAALNAINAKKYPLPKLANKSTKSDPSKKWRKRGKNWAHKVVEQLTLVENRLALKLLIKEARIALDTLGAESTPPVEGKKAK
jgi:hypothetical protein